MFVAHYTTMSTKRYRVLECVDKVTRKNLGVSCILMAPDDAERKIIVSSDGEEVVLPRKIAVTSQVLARHDNGFEVNTIAVPFTLKQVLRSLKGCLERKLSSVEDLRLFDFLGCETIIASTRVRKLCRDDWVQALTVKHCLEQRVIGLRWDGRRGFVSGLTHPLIEETDGYILDMTASKELIDAATLLSNNVLVRYRPLQYRLHENVEYIVDEEFILRRTKGAQFFCVNGQWRFIYNLWRYHIEVHGEQKSVVTARYGSCNVRQLEPYLRRVRGELPTLNEKPIPFNRQWLTSQIEIQCSVDKERRDFFGLVQGKHLATMLYQYPNARCYRVEDIECLMTPQMLTVLGKATIETVAGRRWELRRW